MTFFWIGLAVVVAGAVATGLAARLESAIDRRSSAASRGTPLSVGPLAPGDRRRARDLHEVLLLLAGGPVELLVDGVVHVVEPGQAVTLPAGKPRQQLVALSGGDATWLVGRAHEVLGAAELAGWPDAG